MEDELDIDFFDDTEGEPPAEPAPEPAAEPAPEPAPEPAAEKEDGKEEGQEEGEPSDEERVDFTPAQQAKVDEIARKITARNHETLQQLRDQNALLKQNLPQQEAPSSARPEVPPVPDYFEDGYEQKMAERDAAVAAAVRWDAAQQVHQYQEQTQAEMANKQALDEINAKTKVYVTRATSLGVTPESLKMAGQQVGAANPSPALLNYILEDEAGPALTMHLAANWEELQRVVSMDPVAAGSYIEKEIKPKALAKVAPPPKPKQRIRGGGKVEAQIGPEGCTFE